MARGIKIAKLRKLGNSYGIIFTKAEIRALGIKEEWIRKGIAGLKVYFEPVVVNRKR